MSNTNEERLGNIKISEDVIFNCIATAVLKTSGVFGLFSSFSESLTKNILGKESPKTGIKLSQDDEGYTVDLSVIVEYAVSIPEVAWNIQESVKKEVEAMTGEKVCAVNINVQDVHFPDEEEYTND